MTATLTLSVEGMDCASCAAHIEEAVGCLPGVEQVQVLVSAERATVSFDPDTVSQSRIKEAIGAAGYTVRDERAEEPATRRPAVRTIAGCGALGLVGVTTLVLSAGERLGLLSQVVGRLPWWIPALAIVLGGWPVFRGVLEATRRRRITSHTLMSVGVLAAILVGQWTTAALIVFFMRFAGWLEERTAERNRQALKALTALQPAIARVVRGAREVEVGVSEVSPGEIVVVRPGERIPLDGRVIDGAAPVDQASITGESIPLDRSAGDPVFAATIVQAGFLKIETTRVAGDTTFARIVRLVEEAEAQKAPVQRFADRFSTYYLPVVLLIALATFLLTGRTLNAVAVLVVACACAIVLATPVVVLASVGNGARRGLLIKGGLALEQLARVDTVVVDKTGTVTLGVPYVTDVVPLDGLADAEMLRAVASVESRSEHPLARAMVRAAMDRGVSPIEPERFQPLPGRGVVGTVDDHEWVVGNWRLLAEQGFTIPPEHEALTRALETAGKTAFYVGTNGALVGIIAVADAVRPEAREALDQLKRLGIRCLLLLTGDNERVAAAVARELGIEYRANLLPEDKIAAVRALQAEGAVVLMVGDGVNDAPALVQADVGVAMGVAGTDVAIEAADVALMRDDWTLVPIAVRLGRRAARTIRQNLAFTAVYNVVGITLAAVGILPPAIAAAAQSLPDVAIMANSSRLLRGP